MAEAVEIRLAADRAMQAAERIPDEQARKSGIEQRLGDLRLQLAGVRTDLVADIPAEERLLARALDGARALEVRLADARERADSLGLELARGRDALTTAAAEHGRAEEALAAFDRARDELQAVQIELSAVRRLRGGYGLLAEYFRWLPARIIELTVPAIEAEAQRLLERFTEGRLQVELRLQRATKTGGLRETLDVVVSDGITERPYETFSGGERDCVALALRIALARLLAHRAGVPSETLILDEPFTALDTEHLQRAVEVLTSLAEEFRLLLIVTHHRELADALPTRIEVSGGRGEPSRVQTLDQVGAAA